MSLLSRSFWKWKSPKIMIGEKILVYFLAGQRNIMPEVQRRIWENEGYRIF